MSSPLPPRFPDDRTNPYAAPEAEIGTGQYAGLGLSPTPFTVGDVMSRTWQIYKGQMWNCIGLILAYIGLNLVAQLLVNLLPAALARGLDQRTFGVIFLIATICLIIYQIWIGIGQALFMLDVARGQGASFGVIFQGGRYLLPVIFASLAFTLALAGVIAVCMIPGSVTMALTGGDPMVGMVVFGLGVVAAIIGGLILGIRLSQFYYLILDRDAGIMESLRLSLEVTSGNVVNFIGIVVMTWLINILGVLACGIGLIFTIPYTVLLFAVTYLALTGQPIADPMAAWKPASDARILGPDGPVSDKF